MSKGTVCHRVNDVLWNWLGFKLCWYAILIVNSAAHRRASVHRQLQSRSQSLRRARKRTSEIQHSLSTQTDNNFTTYTEYYWLTIKTKNNLTRGRVQFTKLNRRLPGHLYWWDRQKLEHETNWTQTSNKKQPHCWTSPTNQTQHWLGLCTNYNKRITLETRTTKTATHNNYRHLTKDLFTTWTKQRNNNFTN